MTWFALSAGYFASLALIAAVTYRHCQRLAGRVFHKGWCAGAHATASVVRHQLALRGIAVEFADAPRFNQGEAN